MPTQVQLGDITLDIVRKVDLKAGVITVALIPGLEDL